MTTYKPELTSLDIMLITDALIDMSKKCESVTTLEMTLDLINTVQRPMKKQA